MAEQEKSESQWSVSPDGEWLAENSGCILSGGLETQFGVGLATHAVVIDYRNMFSGDGTVRSSKTLAVSTGY